MKKWTVRVDDEPGEVFADFCAKNGVTIAAFMTTLVDMTCARYLLCLRESVESWPAESLTEPEWLTLVERARAIDAERRTKKTSPPRSSFS